MNKVLALVPARGGSKGVPRKNIRLLYGKPLIAWTIEIARACNCIDRIIVSTDDAEIAAIAEGFGAEVPFMRPKELAEDNVPDQPVFRHALSWLKDREGYSPDFVLNLRPTTPFKTVADVQAVVNKWEETNCDCVRTVTESGHHPYWMMKLHGDRAAPLIENIDLHKYHQRQLLPKVYYLNGIVDGMTPGRIMSDEFIFDGDIRVVTVPAERAYEIDSEFDFELCELLMEKLHGK